MSWLSNIGRAALGVATGGLSEAVSYAMGSDLDEALPFVGGARTNQLNREFAREQFEYQKGVDARNFANQDRQFNEQSYLNRNGIQIQAADAQKAGINPLAMSSGTLSTASASNVSSSTVNGSQPSVDSTGALMSLINIASQKSMNNATNETSEKNTEANNKTAENINAQDNATKKDIAKMEIDAKKEINDKQLQQANTHFYDSLEEISKSRNVTENYYKSIQSLNNMNEKVSEAELYEKCRQLSNLMFTGKRDDKSMLERLGIRVENLWSNGKPTPNEFADYLFKSVTGRYYGSKKD